MKRKADEFSSIDKIHGMNMLNWRLLIPRIRAHAGRIQTRMKIMQVGVI